MWDAKSNVKESREKDDIKQKRKKTSSKNFAYKTQTRLRKLPQTSFE